MSREGGVPDEIRLWRVGQAIHANIPRTVVRQPCVIGQRQDHGTAMPGRRELLDLALNLLNLFVPPAAEGGGPPPVKCFRGSCSAFAARHHAQFMSDFVDDLAGTGGTIESARIRAWIEMQRSAEEADGLETFDAEDFAESA